MISRPASRWRGTGHIGASTEIASIGGLYKYARNDEERTAADAEERTRDEEAKKHERNPEERALLGRHQRPTFDLTAAY